MATDTIHPDRKISTIGAARNPTAAPAQPAAVSPLSMYEDLRERLARAQAIADLLVCGSTGDTAPAAGTMTTISGMLFSDLAAAIDELDLLVDAFKS